MLALIEELSQILKKQNQPGFAGATSAPSSGANHFMSSPPSRSGILSGPELSMSSRSPGAKTITQPPALSLTNGSASSGSAGKPTLPTTRCTIWTACAKKVHRCSPSPPPNQKLLDSSLSDGLLGRDWQKPTVNTAAAAARLRCLRFSPEPERHSVRKSRAPPASPTERPWPSEVVRRYE